MKVDLLPLRWSMIERGAFAYDDDDDERKKGNRTEQK